MARPVTFNLVVVNGAVQSFDSDFLGADDLPRPSPDPSGGYAFPSYIQVDQHGRVLEVTAGADGNFAYTDVANVFTAIPQVIESSLTGVQWQFGLDPAERSVRWVKPGDATTYAEVSAKRSAGGGAHTTLYLRVVDGGVTQTEWVFSNPAGTTSATTAFTLTGSLGVLGQFSAVGSDTSAVVFSVQGASGQTANLAVVNDGAGNLTAAFTSIGNLALTPQSGVALTVTAASAGSSDLSEWRLNDTTLVAFVNAKGSLKLNGQAGEYPLQVFTADGLTSIFRVSNLTGETQIAGEVGTSTGIRALAFGVYMGVSTAQRFVFNNTGIDVYDFNTTDNVLRLHAVASQTGEVFQVYGQSSTTDRVQAALDTAWVDSTDATRKARAILRVYDTAAREVMRGEASGSAPMVGFLGSAAVVQQTSGANLTNNVTSGGTTDTVADFTDLIIYANDAAAIRNDIYQLARKLKQVNDALRLYGLLS